MLYILLDVQFFISRLRARWLAPAKIISVLRVCTKPWKSWARVVEFKT